MMKGMGALVLAVATILVCCRADSRQDPDSAAHNSREKFEGHKAGGGSFIRQTRDTRPPSYLPYLLAQYDYSPYGGKRDLWTLSPTELRSGYYALGLPKRNFDEIDRSGLDNFVKKRNFDEIDLSAMPFPISKRDPRAQNFDEIDLSSMPFPYKRGPHLRNFDEIDLSSMPFPYSKRSAHLLLPRIMAAESSFISKLPRFTEDQIPHGIKRARHNVKTYVGEGDFDEIDASMFPIGNS